MKKIFKKSLALMVSAALCLTAFVCCLTVNAEGETTASTKTATVTVGPGEAAVGATSVTVPVTLTASKGTEIAAARFSLVIDSTKFTVADYNEKENTTGFQVSCSSDASGKPAPTSGSTYIFLVDGTSNGEDIKLFTKAEFEITLNIADGLAAGDYAFAGYEGGDATVAISEACDAGDYTIGENGALIFGSSENEVALSIDYGSVKIVEEATCDHANATYDYSVVDGNCITKLVCPDCGTAETIATVSNQPIYKAPVLKAGLAIAFRIEKANFAAYNDVHMVFNKDLYTGNEKSGVGTTTLFPNGDTNYPSRYTFLYTDLAAKEMCSNIEVNFYGTDSNGRIVLLSNSNYSLITYIEKYHNANLASTTASGIAMKNLMADMAAYGAYAQKYYSYHLDRTPVDNISTVNDLPTTFNTSGIQNTGFNIYKSPLIANDISVTLRVNKSDLDAYGENIYFVIEYVDYNNIKQPDIIIDFADFTYVESLKRYEFTFNAMTASSAYLPFTAKVMQKSTTDEPDVSLATAIYSLEKYAENQYTKDPSADLTKLAQSMINYSTSAQAYFVATNS